jgi:hypothetical protein
LRVTRAACTSTASWAANAHLLVAEVNTATQNETVHATCNAHVQTNQQRRTCSSLNQCVRPRLRHTQPATIVDPAAALALMHLPDRAQYETLMNMSRNTHCVLRIFCHVTSRARRAALALVAVPRLKLAAAFFLLERGWATSMDEVCAYARRPRVSPRRMQNAN